MLRKLFDTIVYIMLLPASFVVVIVVYFEYKSYCHKNDIQFRLYGDDFLAFFLVNRVRYIRIKHIVGLPLWILITIYYIFIRKYA